MCHYYDMIIKIKSNYNIMQRKILDTLHTTKGSTVSSLVTLTLPANYSCI
ncbi:hypothetical protein BMW23_0515 [Bodo saltans virus]|uniref:Uncharacterized protein n=1 Tax=Bodo saltans virus TaxID=2024608 RepID=A0A2H4UUG2_9VIRU|nr:hypothetical protein QJ851_gp0499 [Bodo saltans virus]ATZ80562.1 hypothetical protein BMW23_0515 [Bodo saltans virus]